MTKIETLNLFEDFLKENLQMTTEDFFSVSFNDLSLSLQWNGRNKPYSFSDVVEKFDGASKFAFVRNYECKWSEDHHWFDIEFTLDAPNDEKCDVRVTIH